MQTTYTAVLLFVLLAGHCAQAAQYRVEGTATYGEGEGDNTSTEVAGVSATWFFGSVGKTGYPLAEAGFVSKQSSMSYRFSDEDTSVTVEPILTLGNPAGQPPPILPPGGGLQFPSVGRPGRGDVLTPTVPGSIDIDTHTSGHTGELRYVTARRHWLVQISGTLTEGDGDGNRDIDGDALRLTLGRYVTPTTTVALFAERRTNTTSVSNRVGCVGLLVCSELFARSKTENETDGIGLNARHLGRLGDKHYALNGFVAHSSVDIDSVSRIRVSGGFFPQPPTLRFSQSISDVWQAGFDATWYFTPRLGVSAGLAYVDQDADQDSLYTASARWFVTPRVALRLQFAHSHLEGPRDDVDTWLFSLAGRL